MSQSQGPWHQPEPEPVTHRYRFLIWIALVAAGWFGLWELSQLFPDSHPDSMDQGYFIRNVAILTLVASGVVYGNRFKFKESVRNIAIWTGIFAIILLGYVYYPQVQDALGNARSELVPGYPVSTGKGEMVFSQDRDGEFLIIGKANGTTVKFLVDTGASEIVLTPDDAARIGIDTSRLKFDRTYETANGEGRGAAYTLDSLQVGERTLFNVPVSVNRAGMRNSLLGMAFLSRMKSFEFRGRRLYLRWR